jgi:hypothetical protein
MAMGESAPRRQREEYDLSSADFMKDAVQKVDGTLSSPLAHQASEGEVVGGSAIAKCGDDASAVLVGAILTQLVLPFELGDLDAEPNDRQDQVVDHRRVGIGASPRAVVELGEIVEQSGELVALEPPLRESVSAGRARVRCSEDRELPG